MSWLGKVKASQQRVISEALVKVTTVKWLIVIVEGPFPEMGSVALQAGGSPEEA